MPRIDIVKSIPISLSGRSRQLEALFDVPRKIENVVEWHGEMPIEIDDWNIGLIVGPSGSGKSSILESLFNKPVQFGWCGASVIDDFAAEKSMVEISEACSAVGFNTIPSWLRPYSVLSNGEKFRVDLARRLIECDDIVLDEFTSLVDRRVAQIASFAVAKYIRKKNRKFIGASCHYDIVDWLQPDWILEPATMTFTRRSLHQRPDLSVTICRVPYSSWKIFAPFHYMSNTLNKTAKCFGLFVDDQLTTFLAVLYRPMSRGHDNAPIYGISRVVTLPDWQGLGLAPFLTDTLAGMYKALGCRFRNYPAHPAFVRVHMKSINWRLIKRAGIFKRLTHGNKLVGQMGGRPNAIFEYIGPATDKKTAEQLLN